MSDEEKNEIKINLLEKEENNNKPSKNVKNFDLQSQAKFSEDNNSDKESIISKSKKSSKSYLDILMRPSFHRNVQNKYESNVPFISEQEAETEKKSQYDYPVNIFKLFLFSWTRKVLTASNSKPFLEISDLGKFSPDLYPDKFLSEIKPVWEKVSKRTKNSPLIKTLLLKNMWTLILIFIGNIFVCGSETLNVLLYRQVILHLDKDPESEPWFNLLTTMILLLVNKFIYNFIFRLYETATLNNSFRVIIQLDSLIYDKLLRTSLYANVSEGSLVNFIQIDAENFGEFFTYTPATFVLPFQILFFIYLLFKFFGFAFLFSLASLIIILIVSTCLQKMRANYQKIALEKKDRRVRTITQVFQIIKIVKLYSWEKYFLNKIEKERNEELYYFKKINTINVLINCIFWSTGPIMSFVSICAYNYFNEEMNLSNILTGLYIFHTLADPLFLLPEYINGLSDSILSLKRIEVFLNKKEYNPTELIKNINPKNDEKIAIEIDGLDFGIIKKREEFEKGEEEEEESEEPEEENNKEIQNNNKKGNNKNDDSDSDEDSLHAKEIELQDIDLTKEEEKEKEKDEILLQNNIKQEKNDKDITLEIKDKKKSVEIIPEVETIELLKDIKLSIEKGDLIGIVGPIGAGKTCLLNAILNNLDVLNNTESKADEGSSKR